MIYLDDNIDEHPKFIGLSPAACWAWVRLLAYCRRHRTDGWVPTEAARARAGDSRTTRRVLAELTSPSPSAPDLAPLLDIEPNGYRLHDYLDWNKSRASLAEESAEKSRLGRLGAQQRAKQSAKQTAKRAAGEELQPRSPTTTTTTIHNHDPQGEIIVADAPAGAPTDPWGIAPTGEDPDAMPKAPTQKPRRPRQPAQESFLEDKKPSDTGEHQQVVSAYFEAFLHARGSTPPFTAADAKAAKTLRETMGVAGAVSVIQNALRDPWGAKNATIRSIASNPAKWVGTRGPQPVSDGDDGFPRGPAPPPPRAPTCEELDAIGRRP